MNNQRNDKWLLILIIILSVGLMGVICFDTIKNNNGFKTTNNNNNTNNIVKDNTKDMDNSNINISTNNNSTIISKLAGLNSKNDEVWYEVKHEGTDYWVTNIYYQNNMIKKVICSDTLGDVKKVYQIGDIILYSMLYNDKTSGLFIIDKEGNTLKEITNYDDNMVLIGNNNFIVNGDTITIYAKRMSANCKDDSINDELSTATYQIKYLGHNELSDMEISNQKTVREICNK